MSATDVCPGCGVDLRGEPIPAESRHYYADDATHFLRMIGHEIPSVYDGVLYWSCPDCLHRWHRWPEGTRMHTAAAPWVDEVTA